MGNFFTDPFGGSFAGRVYTKVAKAAAGDTNYSVLHPEKNNSIWGKTVKSNSRFVDNNEDKKYVETAQKFKKNKWGEDEEIDRSQPTQQPSTWQKIKAKISDWWNGSKSQNEADLPSSPNYVPVSSRATFRQDENVGQ